MGQSTTGRHALLSQWVPGLRAVRTYRRQWARSDVIAGIVLAAILVPQGMAYAELAGLPPVTGLYTTIGCLVGYAVFGPSRILVLGPDSSISPMIFAALVPLLVSGDTHRAIALAGMLAVIVATHRDRHGTGQLGFVADLLSNEVQVGYMNGLAFVIIVGQLPKLFGFSTDAEGFGPELKAFFVHLDSTRRSGAGRGAWGARHPPGAPPLHPHRSPPCWSGSWPRRSISAIFDLHAHGVPTVGSLAEGDPEAVAPLDEVRRHRAADDRRRWHHPGLVGRHHRYLLELRGPAG